MRKPAALVVAEFLDGLDAAGKAAAGAELVHAAEDAIAAAVAALLEAGLSVRETAEVLGWSPSMVQRAKKHG